MCKQKFIISKVNAVALPTYKNAVDFSFVFCYNQDNERQPTEETP
jgi:hypothetical protein